MERDLFGLPITPIEEQEDFSWLNEDDPAVAAPTTEEAEAEESPDEESVSEVEAPEEPETPAESEAVEEEAEATEEEPEAPAPEEIPEGYRWANKYENPKELEKGYREQSELLRRARDRATAYEQQYSSMLERARQLEMALSEAIPFVQAAVAAKQQPQLDEFGQPLPQQPLTPQQIEMMVSQRVAQQTRSAQEQMRSQWTAEREKAEVLEVARRFYENHPDVPYQSEADGEMKAAAQALNEAWADEGYEVDLSDPSMWEIVLEASKRPALLTVLGAKGKYAESDDLMELARFEAALLEGKAPITQTTRRVPASKVGKPSSVKKPVVETASGGSTGGSVDPSGDPWLEAVAEYRKEQRSGAGFNLE